MRRFIVLVWCIVIFVCNASSFGAGEEISLPFKTDSRAQYIPKRVKRMTLWFPIANSVGDKAVKKILRGAKRMPQRTKYRNEYVKEGGFQRAVIDFERARPQNIRYLQEPDTTLVQEGRVGDRTIILKGTVPGQARRPTVTIVKSEQANDPDAVFDVITYSWP